MGYLRIIGVCRCVGLSLLHSGNGAMSTRQLFLAPLVANAHIGSV